MNLGGDGNDDNRPPPRNFKGAIEKQRAEFASEMEQMVEKRLAEREKERRQEEEICKEEEENSLRFLTPEQRQIFALLKELNKTGKKVSEQKALLDEAEADLSKQHLAFTKANRKMATYAKRVKEDNEYLKKKLKEAESRYRMMHTLARSQLRKAQMLVLDKVLDEEQRYLREDQRVEMANSIQRTLQTSMKFERMCQELELNSLHRIDVSNPDEEAMKILLEAAILPEGDGPVDDDDADVDPDVIAPVEVEEQIPDLPTIEHLMATEPGRYRLGFDVNEKVPTIHDVHNPEDTLILAYLEDRKRMVVRRVRPVVAGERRPQYRRGIYVGHQVPLGRLEAEPLNGYLISVNSPHDEEEETEEQQAERLAGAVQALGVEDGDDEDAELIDDDVSEIPNEPVPVDGEA